MSLGDELRRLALQPELADRRSALTELATTVDGGPHRPRWAEIDLFRALNVDGAAPNQFEDSVIAQRLERLLSILIFCPVLLTWVGLYLAGRAYKALLAENPKAATQSFLTLWLDGFNGHTAFGLDHLAFITAGLLLTVIAVTGLLARQRDNDRSQANIRDRMVRQHLRTAVTRASLQLVDFRLASPDRIRERVQAATDQFSRVVEQAGQLATVTTVTLERMQAVAERLEGGIQISVSAAGLISSSSDRLRQAVVDLESGVQMTLLELSTENTGALRQSADHMAQAIADVRSGLDEALSSAGDGGRAMSSAATTAGWAMSSMTAGIQKSLAEVERGIADQATRMESTTAGLREGIVTSLDDIKQGVGAMNRDISAQLTTQVRVLESAGSKLQQGISTSLGGVETVISTVAQELADHVESSSGWVVGATEAVLRQAEVGVSSSQKVYDQVGQTISTMSVQLADVATQDRRANDLVALHSEAVEQMSAVGAALTGFQNQSEGLAGRLAEAEHAADERHRRQEALLQQQRSNIGTAQKESVAHLATLASTLTAFQQQCASLTEHLISAQTYTAARNQQQDALQQQQHAVLREVSTAMERCVRTLENVSRAEILSRIPGQPDRDPQSSEEFR